MIMSSTGAVDPVAVGIIPDGNRRYARKNGIPYEVAYKKGLEVAKTALEFFKNNTDTKYIYFYTLSLDNIRKRSKNELSILYRLLERELTRPDIEDMGVSFIPAGELHLLPPSLQEALMKLKEKTEGHDLKVGLLIAYSGVEEVLRAAKLSTPTSYEEFKRFFYLPDFPDVDLVIRTSGEQRLSTFLPLQAAYAEFIFYPKLWPELTNDDFVWFMEEYARRERRFGK